mmetsp:Transcript_8789/g.19366  ORF Transcript_8789/g.19366 Transcript_8789/m.19366 type:complete len:142 (+) Transcript_8789:3-428(+)
MFAVSRVAIKRVYSVTSSRRAMSAQIQQMTPQDFHSIFTSQEERKNYQFVDVRESQELEELNVVEGADSIIKLPLSTHASWLPEVEDHITQDKPTICICRSGQRSMQLLGVLSQKGYENLYNLQGGMMAYASEVEPAAQRR